MNSTKKTCFRCQKTIYQADPQANFAQLDFHKQCFRCKATGALLTLKTAVFQDGDVYLKNLEGQGAGYNGRGKGADDKPSAVPDVITDRVQAVPDPCMKTADRNFHIAGSGAARGFTGDHQGSQYGQAGDVAVATAIQNPDPNMNTGARKFHIADADGSAYDAAALEVATKTAVVKPPMSVNNINLMEMRHNGGEGQGNKYTGVGKGVSGEAD
jgi:hypothetical protein